VQPPRFAHLQLDYAGFSMQVSFASEPGDPAIPNEDFVAASVDTVVVLDGVTPVDRDDIGCRHGVAWFVRTLGTRFLACATNDPTPLVDCLADAIGYTRDAHTDSCDPSHPDSPAATVAAVRVRHPWLDYLVLSDACVVLDGGDAVRAVTDQRAGAVSRRLRAAGTQPTGSVVRSHRNRADGYWVAAERLESAYESLSGTVDLADVHRVVVATDGATRLVDTFHEVDWKAALEELQQAGPAEWIRRTRQAERVAAESQSRRLVKTHDDATVALVTLP
jgi:hypothetical protein